MYSFKPPMSLVTCIITILMTYDRLSLFPPPLGPMQKVLINSYCYEGKKEGEIIAPGGKCWQLYFKDCFIFREDREFSPVSLSPLHSCCKHREEVHLSIFKNIITLIPLAGFL